MTDRDDAAELQALADADRADFHHQEELEHLRMQLVACSVVALDGRAETELAVDNPYRSPTYDDVLKLRRKLDAVYRVACAHGFDGMEAGLAEWLSATLAAQATALTHTVADRDRLREQLAETETALETAEDARVDAESALAAMTGDGDKTSSN